MIIWGGSYAVTKSAVQVVPPALLAFIRFLIASMIVLPFFLLQSRQQFRLLKPRDYFLLGLMGLTGITGYFLLFNYALIYTSASSGAMIQGSMPLCIALSGALLLKEKLSSGQIAGIILSFGGVLLVAWTEGNSQSTEQQPLLGNLLMLASVLCWTAYTLISRKIRKLDHLSITFLSSAAGTLLLFPFAFWEYLQDNASLSFQTGNWVAILYLAVFSSALGNLLYNKTLQKLPTATVGNFLNLDILTGVLIAVIFLKEQVSTRQLIGGILVLSGLLLSSKTKE